MRKRTKVDSFEFISSVLLKDKSVWLKAEEIYLLTVISRPLQP
jgi:hypothetical protein